MQRRAARFLKNEYSITPGTVTNILTDMKWPTLGHQLYRFPPCVWFKRRQDTRQFHPKKFFQVNAKTNKYSNTFFLHVQSETGNLYQVVSLKSSQWRLSKRPSWAIFKNANPELFIITIFIHLTFVPWLYLNISTCPITHPPWWEIPLQITL